MQTAPQKAVAYVRVSTEEQAVEGVSIEAQTKTLRAYATMKELDLVDVVVDEGVSGGKKLSCRAGGSQVSLLASRRKVQAVLACKLDRLFRNAADCLVTTAEWDKKAVALHLLDVGGQTIDTSSTMGRFFLTVMAGAAEMERGMARDRTVAAMAHMRSTNKRISRYIPFGYDLAKNGVDLVPIEPEQEAIKLIRILRDQGLSLRGVAAELDDLGIETKTGRKWNHNTVAAILKRAG